MGGWVAWKVGKTTGDVDDAFGGPRRADVGGKKAKDAPRDQEVRPRRPPPRHGVSVGVGGHGVEVVQNAADDVRGGDTFGARDGAVLAQALHTHKQKM